MRQQKRACGADKDRGRTSAADPIGDSGRHRIDDHPQGNRALPDRAYRNRSTVHLLQSTAIESERSLVEPLAVPRATSCFPRDVLFGDAAEGSAKSETGLRLSSCGVRQNFGADLAGLFAGYVGTNLSMAS
jgi:hypothetical protein